MRTLHRKEFKAVSGGTNIFDKAKIEAERFKGKVQREADRLVKRSNDRMDGDNLDMDKARKEDEKKLEEVKEDVKENPSRVNL